MDIIIVVDVIKHCFPLKHMFSTELRYQETKNGSGSKFLNQII